MNFVPISEFKPVNYQVYCAKNENTGIVWSELLHYNGLFIKRENPHLGGVNGFKQPSGLWGFNVFPTHILEIPGLENFGKVGKEKKVVKKQKKQSKKHLLEPKYLFDVNNFFNHSRGVFKEIAGVPKDYLLIRKSESGSLYYVSKDHHYLVRVSDHWGKGISTCDWFLYGYKQTTVFNWLKLHPLPKIGIIRFLDFEEKN